MSLIAVFDIGKTNAKLTVTTRSGAVLLETRTLNHVVQTGRYPHADVDGLWAWLCQTLQSFSDRLAITQFVTTTHGATAALIGDGELVFPVMDYEWGIEDEALYANERPSFQETCSPKLPAGLNLGRQIAWLANTQPEAFAQVTSILMYPQYWAWRLTGHAVSEVTSLGCHTDLWTPSTGDFSSLVAKKGWRHLFPPLVSANTVVGTVLPTVALETGLAAHCEVIAGIHDSNASLLPYLSASSKGESLTVLSSGTWLIMANIGGDVSCIEESADMLANVSAYGQAIACARFMGGREFAEIAGQSLSPCAEADISRLISESIFALPAFAETGGPFMGKSGKITTDRVLSAEEKYALATLYLVCVTHYCLQKLGSQGRHVIEGGLAGNPFFAALLAGLDSSRRVYCSDDLAGTTGGALLLCQTDNIPIKQLREIVPTLSDAIQAYYDVWLESALAH
ncbi:L-fuculose kinase [Leeia sp. TBRC 13508]|uniref:L-fuculose kinase n=1 Tax=Leeia speluncae TaxID=2884804 RepID=A0ABS8D543_9NEIS|nr:FGGY family carbohydrate kinase [Leeia speluncae]MCB6183340.1 L-fuculose kinase [Leeia speluncae]